MAIDNQCRCECIRARQRNTANLNTKKSYGRKYLPGAFTSFLKYIVSPTWKIELFESPANLSHCGLSYFTSGLARRGDCRYIGGCNRTSPAQLISKMGQFRRKASTEAHGHLMLSDGNMIMYDHPFFQQSLKGLIRQSGKCHRE